MPGATQIDEKGISATFYNQPIYFEFIMFPEDTFINELKDHYEDKQKHISFLKEEICYLKIEDQLKQPKIIEKIKTIEKIFIDEVCGDTPNIFWNRKQHIIELPYIHKYNIPTKFSIEYIKGKSNSLFDILTQLFRMYNPFLGRGRGRGRGLYDYHFPVINSARGASTSSPSIISSKTAKEVLESVNYFKKSCVEVIFPFYEKDLLLHNKDVWYIKERYLGPHNYLTNEGKNRLYYEHILIETQSIQIVHHYIGEYGKSAITHSKCYIIRVIHVTPRVL